VGIHKELATTSRSLKSASTKTQREFTYFINFNEELVLWNSVILDPI